MKEPMVFFKPSVCFAHEYVYFVRKQRPVDRRDLKDAPVISPTDVLQQWVATFLVKGEQRRHVHFKSASHRLDERF